VPGTAARVCYRPGAATWVFIVWGPGAIAQLGERLLCKQEVDGSIPSGSIPPICERFLEALVTVVEPPVMNEAYPCDNEGMTY
jgi:hypothetical protein